MASTYTPIATTTLGSPTATYTFNSISSGYTDLILIFNGTLSNGPTNVVVTVNSDTGTNYSGTYVGGDGSSAFSGRNSNATGFNPTYMSTISNTTIYQFMNYSNTTTYKTVLARSNATNTNALAYAGLWRGSTGSAVNQPITSITLTNAYNFTTGSTFTLYGIKAA